MPSRVPSSPCIVPSVSQESNDEEGRARLLRGIKRLRSLKLTCTSCSNVRVVTRGYPVKLWRIIEQTDALPPTVGMLCGRSQCCKTQLHFVDWPDDAPS